MLMTVAMLVVMGHRIVTAFGERLAAQNTPQRQKECAVRRQRLEALDRVFRAGWVKTALAAKYRRKGVLVEAYKKDTEFAQHNKCLRQSP
jgi:hypothetical protein